MGQIFTELYRWSEVWPWALPPAIFFIFRVKDKSVRPLIWMSLISLVGSFIAVYCQLYSMQVPAWWRDNTWLYNLLSFCRTVFFGYFLIRIPKMRQYAYPRIVLALYVIAVSIYFLNLGTLKNFNNLIFTVENFILLVFCNTYFLGTILDEDESLSISHPEFIVCAAMAIYGAINFFIYLFFWVLADYFMATGHDTMKLAKWSIIILGILLAIAIYMVKRQKRQTLNPITI